MVVSWNVIPEIRKCASYVYLHFHVTTHVGSTVNFFFNTISLYISALQGVYILKYTSGLYKSMDSCLLVFQNLTTLAL